MKEFKLIYIILKDYYESGAFLKNILDTKLKINKNINKGFVTDFVYGIVRNDIFLSSLGKLLIKKIKKKDEIYIKILFYGIIFGKNTQEAIFVNDYIRYIKKHFGKSKADFFNAVARNYSRDKNKYIEKLKNNKRIFYSVPMGLYEYIEKNIDDSYLKTKIYERMNRLPLFYFRVNLDKADLNFIEMIKDNRVWGNIYRFDEKIGFSDLKDELKKGVIFIQDISSQVIPYVLAPEENEFIADFCSAPGGKTLLLSALTDNKSDIISVEYDKNRYEKLKRDLKDYKNIKVINFDASQGLTLNGKKLYFDKILVDAPCSALGTVSKAPDKKYRFKTMDLSEYAEIQLKILNNALEHLKLGGSLVYSVCTFSREETVDVVKLFLKNNKDKVRLVDFETPDKKFKGNMFFTPYIYDGDIFFIAKFRKI